MQTIYNNREYESKYKYTGINYLNKTDINGI